MPQPQCDWYRMQAMKAGREARRLQSLGQSPAKAQAKADEWWRRFRECVRGWDFSY